MGGDQAKLASKAKLGDEAKKKSPYLTEDADQDRLGELARGGVEGGARSGEEDGEYISKTIQLAQRQFKWMGDDVGDRLEQLKKDITRADKTPWLKKIAEGLLEYAIPLGLGAGAKALSTYFVEKRVERIYGTARLSPSEKASNDGLKELLKSVFKDGAVAGVNIAKSRLGASPENASDAFVDAQKDAAKQGLYDAETNFILKGSDEITTRAQAESLREVVIDYDKLKVVADHQYAATRDAWVSYLAQAKFGSRDAPSGHGKIADMSRQEERIDRWLGDPDAKLAPAEPTPNAAVMGKAPGVLEVIAVLPDIGQKMDGTPTVKAAMLNGVNDAIRDQYKGKSLAEMKIPRQIRARVNGWMPGFTINIDEAGGASALSREEGTWLRARASAGGLSRGGNENLLQDVGLRLLLQELVPADIVEKLGP